MTNEEAIKELQNSINVGLSPDVESRKMAIKALEQASTLDKVMEEIAAYGSIWVEYSIPGHTDHDIEVIVESVLKQAKEQVLSVIDKYRAESEDKT